MSKVALVTGGGTGIGRAISEKLARSGYDIAVSYNSSAKGAEEVVEYARSLGRRAISIKADLSKNDGANTLFDSFEREFKELDLYVNNAGLTLKAPFLKTTEELFDTVCGIDFKSAFFCSQRAAKLMVKNGNSGGIIVISSNNQKAHFANASVYGSVKAAVGKLTEHMAIELAKYGIRANAIAPGWTDTGASRLGSKESTYYKIPLGKWATPDEIADTVIFLASDSAKSITGTTIVIDNGALVQSDKLETYGYDR